MADTRAASGLTPQVWDDEYFEEYISGIQLFSTLMGTSENSIIQVKEKIGKGTGDILHFALVNRLTNDAVVDSDILEGFEEDMSSRSYALQVHKYRNAVRVSEMEEIKSAIDLRNAGRATLMTWSQEHTRDRYIRALESINGVAYASASEAQKDAWLVDNTDRVQVGALRSNTSSLDHSTSLANIDNTADKLTTAAVSLMKRLALTRRSDNAPKIRPVRDPGNGKRYYTMLAHPLCFRDLKESTAMQQAQREVVLETENSRLFEGGDLLWDGVIIKELDDANTLTGVGAGAIDVGRAQLLGAQALATAYGKRWRSRTKEFDYGDKYGVAIDGIYECGKMQFGKSTGSDTGDLVDHGIVTGYFAAVGDA